MPHQWNIADPIQESCLQGVHPSVLVRQVLWNRGMRTAEEARRFLKPDYHRDLHDPFLFRDMEKAVARILKAIEGKERIVIHGDYDADGVCASAILATTLEFLGGSPRVHLPHRMRDGYGLQVRTVESLAEERVDLLITVDCGIANTDAISLATARHIDTIVVDHHRAPETLPSAHAIIHCDIPGESYPFRKLSAGGVAFKLVQALLRTARFKSLHLSERNVDAFEKWLLDLVAISTVADVMPLVGENRTLVHYGLQVLSRSRRRGLSALMRNAGLLKYAEGFNGNGRGLSARDIAFCLAPRLNAAGRIEHASLAYDLLRAEEETQVEGLVQQLERVNQKRQQATEKMFAEAVMQIERMDDAPLIVVANNDWSVGLVGLLAGKLADEYARPVFAIGGMNGGWTGSCRAVPGFDCTAALADVASRLAHWGGHMDAAGFTLSEGVTPEAFREMIMAAISLRAFVPQGHAMDIDAVAALEEVDEPAVGALEAFAPFGEENPVPLLLTSRCRVSEVSLVGKEGNHVKCAVANEQGSARRAIAFGHADKEVQVLQEGALADIVYEPKINVWKGNSAVELYIKDCRLSE